MPQLVAEERRQVTVPVLDFMVDDGGRLYAGRIGCGIWKCECTGSDWQFHGDDFSRVCPHVRAAVQATAGSQ